MKNYRDEIKKFSLSFIEMEIGEIIMKEINDYAIHREKISHPLSAQDIEEIGIYLIEEAKRHYGKLFGKLRKFENLN
ncbi:MAG: hypothetical protein GPJ54_19175 [Candidatus Heimdallarchaeota archaeon]|nr:hypothetical protein [Candidatus Heimdallarchaeota archaeon]